MRLLKFTQFGQPEEPIWVNPEHILSFAARKPGGSYLHIQGRANALPVVQEPSQVLEMCLEEGAAPQPVQTGVTARDLECDVRGFMWQFGLGTPTRLTLPSSEALDIRKRLVIEESTELVEALERGDSIEAVDLAYVAIGTLVACGVQLKPVWDEVHRANMAKVLDPVSGQLQKPAGWKAPDVAGALRGLLL